MLLNYSAKESINKANNSGYTPLFAACERDNPKNVELLLAFGADVNKADNDGMTPLNWACANNNLEIVKLLLVHGAKESINKANNYGWTPLFWACYNNNLEIVKLLLKSGADVDQKSLDAAQDKPEILELLTLVQNYDKNIKTGEYFELPKGKENDENDAENNKKLLAFMDELNETRKKIILIGRNIFEAIKKNDHKRVTEILKDTSFDVNKADDDGNTPLFLAFSNNSDSNNSNLDIITLLLNKGADANVGKFGNTLLHFACQNENLEIVTLLLKYGADVNIAHNKFGHTPFSVACSNNNIDIVKLLLDHGAQESVNKSDNNGWTPLHLACYNNNLEIVKLLLASGADVDQKSLNAAQDKPEILELLTLVQNYDKNIKTGEYFELPKGKENDENDAENNKKLLAFVDELNETRKKIILNKLEKKLSWQLEQNKGKKIKKFGNVEFKYQDDNKVTEFQVSPGEFKKLIEKRKREEEEENDNDNLNKRRKTDE